MNSIKSESNMRVKNVFPNFQRNIVVLIENFLLGPLVHSVIFNFRGIFIEEGNFSWQQVRN